MSSGNIIDVYQVGHGFTALQVLNFNETSELWELALADDIETAGSHVVSQVFNVDNFKLISSGNFVAASHGLGIPGTRLYVSETIPGAVTATPPSIVIYNVMTVESADILTVFPPDDLKGSGVPIDPPLTPPPVEADVFHIDEQFIELNSLSATPQLPTFVSGIIINRGTEIDYALKYVEDTETFVVGPIDSLQRVGTIEPTPTDSRVMIWNDTLKRADTEVDSGGTDYAIGLTGTEFVAGAVGSQLPVALRTPTPADGEFAIWANATQRFDTLSVNLLPVGSIIDYSGSTEPANWLFCYGQTLTLGGAGEIYETLFAVIGTTYGGTGSNDFNLPDCRGRILAGRDDMGGVSADRLNSIASTTLGASAGAQTHVLTTGELPAHTHSVSVNSSGAHIHQYADSTSVNSAVGTKYLHGSSGTDLDIVRFTENDGAHTHTISETSVGSGTAHNNIQPTFIINKIIKAVA